MGVRATLVMPILLNGRLWGLISCHHTRQFGGPGPDLTISARLIERLGGDLAIDSDPTQDANVRSRIDDLARPDQIRSPSARPSDARTR
jgi:hypothetical protein